MSGLSTGKLSLRVAHGAEALRLLKRHLSLRGAPSAPKQSPVSLVGRSVPCHSDGQAISYALCGGVWGALLARVLAEMWPLGPATSSPLPCWLLTPFSSIALGLGGALGALLWSRCTASASKRMGHAMPGRATATLAWPLALGMFYLVQPAVSPLWGLAILIAGLGGVLWLQKQTRAESARPVEWAWDLLVLLLALALYVGTLAPSVLPGDSGEFQFVAPMLGIPHPTGYPLYLLLGKLFSLVPLRSVAYRLNLLSAVAAAGTVWAVYRCGRALGMRRSAAILSGGLLALSETFWSQATVAEKYTLNAFFVALTLWLGLQWRQKRLQANVHLPANSHTSSEAWLSAWAFCYGLSLTHHRTMLLLAPAYLYLVWATDRSVLSRSALARYARLALCVLAPLSLYLLLPLFSARQPPYAYIRLDSARAFWDLVLARDYQGALFQGGWAALPGRLAEFARLAHRQFGTAGLAAALGGGLALYRREKHVAWALVVGGATQVLFALNYYVPNSSVYYLPAFVWLAVLIAPAIDAVLAGLAWLAGVKEGGQGAGSRARGLRPTKRGRVGPRGQEAARSAWSHLALAFVLIAGAWPMALLVARLPGMDRRQTYSRLAFDHTYGQMAARSVEPGALLVSDWLPATVLWYTQWVEGQMPTAQVAVVDPLEGQWAGLVEGALASDRPVYLARPVVAAGDRHSLTSAGPLVRVLDAPLTSAPCRMEHPVMSHPASEPPVFGGEIRLLGGDLVANQSRFDVGVGREAYMPLDERVEGGSTLHVTIYWQALRPPAGDYGVTLRLVSADSTGPSWLERTSRHPVGGSYPTSRWQAGEIVGDYYRLALPPHLPSGEYQLLVSIGESGDAPHEASLARFSIRKPLRWPNPILGTPVRKLLHKGLVWVGYDAPGELVPGETVSIALQWLICGRTVPQGADVELRPRLVLVSREGTERALTTYAGSQEDWQPGALVVDPYQFSVPDDLAYVEVRSALEDRPGHRLALQVASGPPPGANFGAANLPAIRLRDHRYRTESFRPGDIVHLTLEWEALRTMDEAYKVFVHVLGANGLPIAQQDNEPVNGTYPTTRWQPGERISDPYAIRLPEGIPPGEYPVEVGLYRISDLSRLSVLAQDQSVLDDKVFLAPVTVR